MSLDHNTVREWIEKGNTSLGIELGSTRIKAVLIGEDHTPIASGSHDWENRYVDNIWTYTLEDIWEGVQDSFAKLAADVKARYGVTLTTVGSIGISAMMHGEYGIEGIALSMPAIVGFDGIETHVPISLNEEEQRLLQESAETLKSVAAELDL